MGVAAGYLAERLGFHPSWSFGLFVRRRNVRARRQRNGRESLFARCHAPFRQKICMIDSAFVNFDLCTCLIYSRLLAFQNLEGRNGRIWPRRDSLTRSPQWKRRESTTPVYPPSRADKEPQNPQCNVVSVACVRQSDFGTGSTTRDRATTTKLGALPMPNLPALTKTTKLQSKQAKSNKHNPQPAHHGPHPLRRRVRALCDSPRRRNGGPEPR